MQTIQFLGLECVPLENKSISLLVTQSAGPRILSLRLTGGENLFAELPNETLDCPGKGKFHFFGGHRLWHAPEDPARTYLPDDGPVEMLPLENGLKVTQQVEAGTGIEKSMHIRLPEEGAKVTIRHTLTNRGLWPVECAPWAITQMKLGGAAILPQSTRDTGVLANRPLVIWPYTDINDAHLQLGNRYIFIRTGRESGAVKLGFPNPRGWLAYWQNGALFVKKAAFDPAALYYDFGSSSQCYCDHRFLELETLAPVSVIPPGGSVSHTEGWEVFDNIDFSPDEDRVQALIEELGLEK
jgi:hypothetical protein